MNTYEISIPVFEGPMDLLMYLVNKNRIDIKDIPIHFITEQYLAYLNQAGEFNLPLGSEFFEMAANLLYIKSKTLLPQRRQDEEETENPKAELERSLEEFRLMKEIKSRISTLMAEEQPYRTREPAELKQETFNGKIPLARLNAAFLALYEELEPPPQRVLEKEEYTLDEAVQSLRQVLSTGKKMRVHVFLGMQHTRLRLAVSLVALLEMIRVGRVLLEDTETGLYIKEIA